MAQAHWTYAYQRAKAALRRQLLPQCRVTPCKYLGVPIRYDLAYPHPLSFSAEHDPPVSVAGPHLNLVPAHLGCQRSQGADITNRKRWHRPIPRTSKAWG